LRRRSRVGKDEEIDKLLEALRTNIFDVKQKLDEEYSDQSLTLVEAFEWGIREDLRGPITSVDPIPQSFDVERHSQSNQKRLERIEEEVAEVKEDVRDLKDEQKYNLNEYYQEFLAESFITQERIKGATAATETVVDAVERQRGIIQGLESTVEGQKTILEVLRSNVQRMTAVLENFIEAKTAGDVAGVSAAAVDDSMQGSRSDVRGLRSILASFVAVKTAEGVARISAAASKRPHEKVIADLQAENDVLKQDLAASRTVNDILRQDLAASRAGNDILKQDLAASRAGNDVLKQDLAASRAEHHALITRFRMIFETSPLALSGPRVGRPGTVATSVPTAQPAGTQGTIVAPKSSRGIVAPSNVSDASGPQSSIRRPEQETIAVDVRRARVSPDLQAYPCCTAADTADTGE
jgi:hypothetical protein